jgi:signal transduction histidine kinase/CheY-like chemotaxis protein
MTSNRFIYFILSAFIAGNLLLIFMQYNSVKNINNLIEGNEKLLYELQVSNQLREMERDLLSTESKIRGTIATNDTSYLNEIDLRIAETKKYLDSLKLVSDQDSTLNHITRLYAIADEKASLKKQVLDSFHQNGKISVESFKYILQHRKHTNDETNDLSFKLSDSRQRLLDSLSISINRSGKKARTLGTIMIVVVLMTEAGLFWYIISRIKRQNHLIQELDASEKKVREVSMIKENFMANMSHEIRTPMNAILGFTHLLKGRNKDPELTEFVESIRTAAENLLAIINDILDISKIEAGMIRIESVPFSIRELIHSIQILFTEKINEKGLEFTTAIDNNIPDILSGDETRLTQILVNMIGNALKFTSKGGIHIGINNQGETGKIIRVGFVISDTGIGIAKEKLSGIFERFRQAEDSITRKFGGTGLGLSIARDLIILQKGEIDVESEPDKGTTFRFKIPYEITSAKQISPELSGVAGFEYPDLQGIHILVVEDNEMNQNLLRYLLRGWKFSFDIVINGVEALEMLKTRRYNLILMDIQMPEMDGYTATRKIRLELKLEIPIIAMTAHALAGEREKCLSTGMNEYIAKPINEGELYRLITELTGIEENARIFKRNIREENTSDYQYVDLRYMRDISDGNREYERIVTEQFIETIPKDLIVLESALMRKDVRILRHTAHDMKTNVSVMGLSDRLQPFLDVLENGAFHETHFQQIISSIKTICMKALPEAKHFYSTL